MTEPVMVCQCCGNRGLVDRNPTGVWSELGPCPECAKTPDDQTMPMVDVYRMPEVLGGDWAARCDPCGIVSDGFETEAEAKTWCLRCPQHTFAGSRKASEDDDKAYESYLMGES